jgi:dTMP kinase
MAKETEANEDTRGILITMEGSEGCGKTTQIRRLARRLQEEEIDVVVTREPGGTEIGEEIRHLLKYATSASRMTPEAEVLLFAASRAQLVRELIVPSLEDGKIVLCDRFIDSTTVYQGVARELGDDPVQIINSFAVDNMQPDLTIVVDVPAELGMKRVKSRFSDLPDRMEQENIDFYAKIREGYLLLAKSLDRFMVVDGTKSIEVIEEEIWAEIQRRFFLDD